MTEPTPWWRHAVVYQIYIRSFADSDGDGVGDIAGIRSRLPYLRDLGVDAIWINPWYPSPMVDGGYDVADYRAIDPAFGTMDEALAFIDDVHAHGLRILLDIVPNHTSDQHPWFQEALASPPGSPARARYLFREGKGPGGDQPPTDWPSVFGGPAWTRVIGSDGRPGQWYLHLFAPEQPDLDWSDPEVADEFDSILRFWYDRGVDGFRIDVAHGLVKDRSFPDLHGSSPKVGIAGPLRAQLLFDFLERREQALLLHSQPPEMRGAGSQRRLPAEKQFQQELVARRLRLRRLGEPVAEPGPAGGGQGVELPPSVVALRFLHRDDEAIRQQASQRRVDLAVTFAPEIRKALLEVPANVVGEGF